MALEEEVLIAAVASLSADEHATLVHLEEVRRDLLVVLDAARDQRIPWERLADAHGSTWQALKARVERAKRAAEV